MNSHEEIQRDLPAYIVSRLEESALRRVEQHLSGCDDCREMADTLRELGQAVRDGEEALFEPHPAESSLRKYVGSRGTIGGEGIARHLAICASCSLEVEAWSKRADGKRAPGSPVPRAPRWGSMALASAASLAVGFGLSLLLRQGGAPSSPPGSSRVSTATEAGLAVGPLLVLHRALRGEGTAVTYALDPNQAIVVVACPASIPDGAAPKELFRYEIREAGGGVVWSRTMTAADIRRHMTAGAEVVTLLVPAVSVEPGQYDFRLFPAARPEELLYHAGLETTRSR